MLAMDTTVSALRWPLKARYITRALGPTPGPRSSAGSRAALGEKGSLCIPSATVPRGSQLGHCMACSLQTTGNHFWKQNGFRTLSALQPGNPPYLLSTSHHICYLHVIIISPDNGHQFCILCPQGFRQLTTPPALGALSSNCWSNVTQFFFFPLKIPSASCELSQTSLISHSTLDTPYSTLPFSPILGNYLLTQPWTSPPLLFSPDTHSLSQQGPRLMELWPR